MQKKKLCLKPVAHWTLKGLTILHQKMTKSVPKSVGPFFRGGSMENVKYVPSIMRNVRIWYIFGRTHK